MDPHHFRKLDPHPHPDPIKSGKLDPDPHQSEKQDPDPHQSEKQDTDPQHCISLLFVFFSLPFF
jgi:hypothetical protein